MSDPENNRWLLPEGIEEILPVDAARLETVRRRLLDMYATWGYEMIVTPMVEYLESLQTGTGKDLDLQTFKVIDTQNGRMMGIRADITPQAARIDAHLLNRDVPVRLCYLGTVLRAYADRLGGTRAPLQIGAELYGHGGIESDIEIIELTLETMKQLGISHYHLDLGHVAIYRELVNQAGLTAAQDASLFDALKRKALPELHALLNEWKIPDVAHQRLSALANLNGGVETLQVARELFGDAGATIGKALDELEQIADRIQQHCPGVPIHFDLAELRGYNYQSGVVFAVLVPGAGHEVARGGRYDDFGKAFGSSRPATGFSADLKTLLELVPAESGASGTAGAIFAPADNSDALQGSIASLRAAGERVVCELPGQQGDAAAMGCDRQLVLEQGEWQVKKL